MMAFSSWWVFVSTLIASAASQSPTVPSNAATYTNPIVPNGADPWVTRHDGYYYMTYTTTTNITILRSHDLVDWSDAEVKLAFDPPPGQNYSTDLWAPVSLSSVLFLFLSFFFPCPSDPFVSS